MSSVSLFEANKPAKTYKAIKKLIAKYKKIVDKMPIMDDEDAIKVEMAYDFTKELSEIMKIFKSGE
tara:strand:+ start:1042 stop:1239 length:198 start_codon:yes stop_codon:yes gene_type:complete